MSKQQNAFRKKKKNEISGGDLLKKNIENRILVD